MGGAFQDLNLGSAMTEAEGTSTHNGVAATQTRSDEGLHRGRGMNTLEVKSQD